MVLIVHSNKYSHGTQAGNKTRLVCMFVCMKKMAENMQLFQLFLDDIFASIIFFFQSRMKCNLKYVIN